MSGRAKRASTSTSKYEEVDSDVDMNEEDKEISTTLKATRGSSSAFGLCSPAPSRHPPNFEGFQALSLVAHMELKGSWTAARKRLSLPLPAGMTESFLAYLLYGTECFLCDRECRENYYNIAFFLASRTRCCRHCFNAGRIQSLPRVLKAMTGLHVDAAKCAPHVGMPVSDWNPSHSFRYFTFDGVVHEFDRYMETVSEELRALESGAGDVVAQKQSRDSRMARRSMATEDGGRAAEDPVIAAYDAEKRAWIMKAHSETESLEKAIEQSRRVEREESDAEVARSRALRDRRQLAIKAKGVEIGYSPADMDCFHRYEKESANSRWTRFPFSEEEWNARREELVAKFNVAQRNRATEKIAKARRDSYLEEQRRDALLIGAKLEDTSDSDSD